MRLAMHNALLHRVAKMKSDVLDGFHGSGPDTLRYSARGKVRYVYEVLARVPASLPVSADHFQSVFLGCNVPAIYLLRRDTLTQPISERPRSFTLDRLIFGADWLLKYLTP